MKTRTIEYQSAGGLKFVDIDVPDPSPGQVQISMGACGVCAFDVFAYKHGMKGGLPGHEGVGRITKLGAGVTQFKLGQRVVGHCLGFAERQNIGAANTYAIPDSSLPDEHWVVEPVSCCVTGIDHCHLRAADKICLIGCGFMGLILLQGLGHSLCDRIVAIDIDPKRLELAKQFGATETINSADASFAARLPELKAMSFDTVIDSTGVQIGLDTATKISRKGGRIVLFGWNHGRPTVDGDAWHHGGLTIINATPNSAIRDPWPAAVSLMRRGFFDLRPLVSHVVSFEDFPKLLEEASAKKGGYMKGVVKIG